MRSQFDEKVTAIYAKLAASIPQEQFYRFANQLKSTNQQAVFLASWLVFIESEQLLDPSKFAALTGGSFDDDG